MSLKYLPWAPGGQFQCECGFFYDIQQEFSAKVVCELFKLAAASHWGCGTKVEKPVPEVPLTRGGE